MDWSHLALLLPGLFVEKVVASLSVRKERGQFEALTSAVVWSLVIVLVTFALQHTINDLYMLFDHTAPYPVPSIDFVKSFSIELDTGLVLLSSLICAFYAITYLNQDGHRLLRKWGLTQRQTFPDTWTNFLWHMQTGVVRVDLTSGLSIEGTLSHFDDHEKNHIVIKWPTYLVGSERVDCKNISLLLRVDEVAAIMFTEETPNGRKRESLIQCFRYLRRKFEGWRKRRASNEAGDVARSHKT